MDADRTNKGHSGRNRMFHNGYFAALPMTCQFSVLSPQFSIFNSQLSTLNSQLSTLSSHLNTFLNLFHKIIAELFS